MTSVLYKNISGGTGVRIILSCALIFFPGILSAQSGNTDSTVRETYQEPPPEQGPVIDTVAPDETKRYFRERSASDSFILEPRTLPADHVQRMKKDKSFWYADAVIKKKEPPKSGKAYTPLSEQTWFQTLLWLVIIGGFAAALVWYLSGSQVGLFRKKSKAVPGAEETEEMPEDIFSIRYQREIDKAAAQGNFRLAVRLHFLRLLKLLAEKNMIRYKQDKTNFDYLVELRPNPYYPHFFRLTRHYEYSWYGHFAVQEEVYRVIRGEFDRFEQEIN